MGSQRPVLRLLLLLTLIQPSTVQAQGGNDANSAESANLADPIPWQNLAPPHFVRMEHARITDDRSDYFEEILKQTENRVCRFKYMPVPVFIASSNDQRFWQACREACSQWQSRTLGRINFVFVSKPANARIRLFWGRSGLQGDRTGALSGHTVMKWQKSDGRNRFGLPARSMVPPEVIEINLDLVESHEFEEQPLLVRNLVIHELGHALGLFGHSPDRNDIMFSDADQLSRLSQRDVNTMLRLYNSKVDVAL